eukprot:Skav227915  [mRNA]  locus=scaffold146:141019:142389:+ [translate_table: standard]
MHRDDLQLEPRWFELAVGHKVDVQADLVIFDEGHKKHLLRSVLGQRFFIYEGFLAKKPAYSFLQVDVVEQGPRLRLRNTKGYVLGHDTPAYQMYEQAIDTCSGIGVMRDGVEACGIRVTATNELRPVLCEWQTAQGREHIITGDLGEPLVLAKLHACAGGSSMLLSGFSCQPWSRLGDGGKFGDIRSTALHKALRAAFFLRSHSVMLECVSEAGVDQEVIQTLRKFCSLVNFRVAHATLHLDHVMPARRTRWWALLTNKSLPPMSIRPLPRIEPTPVVGDLLPVLPEWDDQAVRQLSLDMYETRKFREFGGLDKNIVNLEDKAPTALHGWGNQLGSCPCGCRDFPLSERRLESKGLHGALVLIGGSFNTFYGPSPCTRHLHPWEISVLNGAMPDKQWGPVYRLDIAGLGQMASPIQSCWVTAEFQSHCAAAEGLPVTPPEEKLWGNLFWGHPQGTS